MTGEGADEHFGGYPLYQADFLREPDQTVEEGPLMTKMTDSERKTRLAQIEAENKAEYERIGGNTVGWEQSVPRSMLNNVSSSLSRCGCKPYVLADHDLRLYDCLQLQLLRSLDC